MGNKYALITGGSRGIGKAIALKLATELAYNIIIVYRNNDEAAIATKNEIEEHTSVSCELWKFDVAQKEQADKAINNWLESHPEDEIEVIVNNAGITRDGLFMAMSIENWNDVLNTTLQGFYNITQPLVTPMVRKRFGRIINIASVSGVKGTAGQTNYSAAKAALIGATKALGKELAKRKITVNAVAPGFINSDMTQDLDEKELKKIIPANRFGNPEEVADLVCFLASKKSSYITGEVININGGLHS
jgi:3-oxoacyl-[acyl-carrier protein] reductase